MAKEFVFLLRHELLSLWVLERALKTNLWRRISAFVLAGWISVVPLFEFAYGSFRFVEVVFLTLRAPILSSPSVWKLATAGAGFSIWDVAVADSFSDAVNAGKNAGAASIGSGVATVPAYNPGAGTVSLPVPGASPGTYSSEEQPTSSVFSGGVANGGAGDLDAQNELNSAKASAAGANSTAFGNMVNDQTLPRLENGTTPQAMGYQSITAGSRRPHVDLSNDPSLWNQTRDTHTTGLASITQSCSETTNTQVVTGQAKTTDIRSCNRTVASAGCQITRTFALDPNSIGGTVLTYAGDIDHELRFDFGIFDGYAASCNGNNSAMLNCGGTGFLVTAESMHGDKDGSLSVSPLGAAVRTLLESAIANGKPYRLSLTIGTSSGTVPTISISQLPSASNNWKGSMSFFTPEAGEQYTNTSVIVNFVLLQDNIVDTPAGCRAGYANWLQSNGVPPCTDCVGSITKEASNGAFECTDAAYDRMAGTVNVTTADWGSHITPLFYNEPAAPPAAICYSARLRGGVGTAVNMNCYTTADGSEYCPVDTVVPEHSDCQTLQSDPSCSFLSEQCVDGAVDPSGACTAWYSKYECGEVVEVVTGSTSETTYSCAGDIRCMGQECVDNPVENNSSFGKVTSYLNVAEQAGVDGSCKGLTEGQPCLLFNGTKEYCKKAMYGVVNCCESVGGGLSWVEYMQFGWRAWQVASNKQTLAYLKDQGIDVQGSWTTIKDAGSQVVTDGVSYLKDITEPITSALDTAYSAVLDYVPDLGMNALSGASDVVVEGASSTIGSLSGTSGTISQWVTNQAAGFIKDTFGEEAMKMMFEEVTDGAYAFATEATAIGPNSALGMAANFLSVVMWVYSIVQLVLLVIRMIYKCGEDEFQMTMKRDMRLCHYIGDECVSKFMGSCIENHKVHCCYNTLFSRVLNEQVRDKQPSLKSWGSPANPDCKGFTADELERVDFNRLDLSEWIASLTIAGIAPSAGSPLDQFYSRENLTSHSNPNAPGGWNSLGDGPTTETVVGQTVQSGGMGNSDAARIKARNSLWGN